MYFSEEKQSVLKFFLNKEKPWRAGKSKEYFWKSSIPEKWVEIKGETFFIPNSKLKKPKLSIDLLQNTQKYLVDIQNYNQSRSALVSPAKIKQTPKSNRRLNREGVDFIGTSNVRPDPLSSMVQSRPSSVRYAGNSKNSNLRYSRFDYKPCSQEHPIPIKGLQWKLKKVQTSQKRRKSLIQAIEHSDQTDLMFKSICSNKIV